MKWLKSLGGLAAIAKVNERKAAKLYAEIDRSGFYRGTAQKESRSLMNVTFRLATEELEKLFVKETTAAGLDGLKGHRDVGGMRASIYNAFPEEGIDALIEFMSGVREKARIARLRGLGIVIPEQSAIQQQSAIPYVLSLIACNASRSSRFGSFATLHSAPRIIVARCVALYAGQFGRSG